MKTIINEVAGDYQLVFPKKEELEAFISSNRGMVYISNLPMRYPADNHVHYRSVEMRTVDDDMEFIFKENGMEVKRQKIPIKFLRWYDQVCEGAFKIISESFAKENGEQS